jgi:hypothetical protein
MTSCETAMINLKTRFIRKNQRARHDGHKKGSTPQSAKPGLA